MTCRVVCGNHPRAQSRPRWATLHPDNWTVLEVGEWLDTVVSEYGLGNEVKVALTHAFCDVDGRRLATLTLEDFLDLDPRHGHLLYSVFHRVALDGFFRREGGGRGEGSGEERSSGRDDLACPPLTPDHDIPHFLPQSSSPSRALAAIWEHHHHHQPPQPQHQQHQQYHHHQHHRHQHQYLMGRPLSGGFEGPAQAFEDRPAAILAGSGSGRFHPGTRRTRHSSVPCPSSYRDDATSLEDWQMQQERWQQQQEQHQQTQEKQHGPQQEQQQQQQHTGTQSKGPKAYSRSYSS